MSHKSGLPETGFVRLSSIIGSGRPVPVSKSTGWEGIRTGRYPARVKLGPRITAWRVEDIRQLILQCKAPWVLGQVFWVCLDCLRDGWAHVERLMGTDVIVLP